jgi:hypothetical protein
MERHSENRKMKHSFWFDIRTEARQEARTDLYSDSRVPTQDTTEADIFRDLGPISRQLQKRSDTEKKFYLMQR